MKIAIIGSGISGILVAKTFLEANYEVYLYDANNLRKKTLNKKKLSFLPQTKISPKYDDPLIKKGISQFKKNYGVKIKNFFLASPLLTGGMSNFWGGGIEIPENSYLRKYAYMHLLNENISSSNIEISNLCTYESDGEFNSWRRNKTKARQWSFISP